MAEVLTTFQLGILEQILKSPKGLRTIARRCHRTEQEVSQELATLFSLGIPIVVIGFKNSCLYKLGCSEEDQTELSDLP